MKKSLCSIILAVLSISLCACGGEPQTDPKPAAETESPQAETISIILRNEVREADVWIIPDTEDNRSTSIWGTATVAGAAPGSDYSAELAESDTYEYLLRMIDTEGIYYEANTLTLSDGCTVTLTQNGNEVKLEIRDADGEISLQDIIFHAAL